MADGGIQPSAMYNVPVKPLLFAALFSTTLLAQAAPSLQFRGDQGSKHATIVAAPVEVTAAGGKASLFVEVTPKPGIHVYAPGSKDYIPISVKLDAVPGL